MVRDALRAWSPRQWVAAALTTPVLAAALVAVAGVPLSGLPAGWLALAGLAAVLGGGVAASHVPRHGVRPDTGCAPAARREADRRDR